MDTRGTGTVGRRGSTLIPVTILIGTMTVLALVFLRVGQRMSAEQDASLETARAALLAEAGVAEALESMRSGMTGSIGTAAQPAALGGGVLWVEATDLGGGRTQLDSMAMKDSGRAALRVVVAGSAEGAEGDAGGADGFQTMLFSNKALQIKQDIVIDSYDSALGTYDSQAINTYGGVTYAGSAGGATSNGSLQLDAGVKVFGDASAGPGLNPTVAATAYLSGTSSTLSQPIQLKQIAVPPMLPGVLYSVANNTSKTLAPGNYSFLGVTQGKFSKLTIQGPATLVLGSYVTGVSATLELDCSGGPITIYDTGAWSVDKNYTVGPKAGTEVDAAFLISSPGTVQFDQGSKIYVGFYAPNATIQVDQGAEVWGGLAADEIVVGQGTRFHFDENLRNFDLPWEIPAEDPADAELAAISWAKIEFPLQAYSADRRDPFTLLGVSPSDLPAPSAAWQKPEQDPKGDQ